MRNKLFLMTQMKLQEGSISNDPIRIFVVDDHKIFRLALRAWIATKPSLTIIGEASNGDEAVQKVLSLQPDIVLLDFEIQNDRGLEVLRRIKQKNAEIDILILTSSEMRESMQAAIDAGAQGYLHKALSTQELYAAIMLVCSGKIYIDSSF